MDNKNELVPQLGLTTQSLIDSGIHAHINQNDLIELIAQEQFDTITSEINEVNKRADAINQRLGTLLQDQKQEFIDDLVHDRILNKEQADRITVQRLNIHLPTKDLELDYETHYSCYPKIICGSLSYKDHYGAPGILSYNNLKGKGKLHASAQISIAITFTSQKVMNDGGAGYSLKRDFREHLAIEKLFNIPETFRQSFNEELDATEAALESVYEKYKYIDFDLEKIIRQTKAKFTKTVLSAQGGAIKEALNTIFNLNL